MDRATATKRFHRELSDIIARVSLLLHELSWVDNLDSVNDFQWRQTAGLCLLPSIAAQEQQPLILHPLIYGGMRWMIL